MKRYIYILWSVLLFACNSEDANDCLQTSGAIIQQEFEISDFNKILINKDVELIVTQGLEQKVIIETGENLLNDIDVTVVDNILTITDNNDCNWIRDYGITKAYVTVTEITEIRSASQYKVSSIGTIQSNNLTLITENYWNPEYYNLADFHLDLDCNVLRVITNGLSVFYLTGTANNLEVSFYAGLGKFEGENLVANNIDIYHRGTNDMIVYPVNKLTGELRSTGNLISVNQPPIVEVEQHYTGQLIFN